MEPVKIVSREEWLTARTALLAKEKEFTRRRDQLNAARRALPWVRIEKEYVFDTLDGSKTLTESFDGRSQLVVDHFMLGPGWKAGCVGCSFGADHMGNLIHLEHHDVTRGRRLARAARRNRSLPKADGLELYLGLVIRQRLQLRLSRVFQPGGAGEGQGLLQLPHHQESGMDELPGLSVFYKDENGNIFHTYSSYARGTEELITTYMVLDLTPKGRNETGPRHNLMDWVRRHDEYDQPDTQSSRTE